MLFKRLRSERGITLVEGIAVIALGAMLIAMVGPKIMEGMNKSKSNALKDELMTITSAIIPLEQQGSATHAVKVDVKTTGGQTLMQDYIVTVAPSTAFQTVIASNPFRPDSTGNTPVEMAYGLNTITLTSDAGHDVFGRHTGNLADAPIPKGTAIMAPELGSQGSTGIGPLFNLNETKLMEDFIISPNGLNFGEFRTSLSTPDEILSTIFGGGKVTSNTTYDPYSTSAASDTLYKRAPIELTKFDITAVDNSSAGASLKTLTDASRGGLYMVTSLMSEADFIATLQANTALWTTPPPADVLVKMYDVVRTGFQIGAPVYIPYREKDMIKSTDSDLKFGLYRQ